MDIRVYVDVGIIQNRGHRYFINVKYLILLENQILYIQSITSQSVNEYIPLFSSSLKSLVQSVSSYRWVLSLYLVPASLYCLYNNLSFVSLQYFNPTTYFMFMQIRLLLTGVIYQVDVWTLKYS